MIHITKSNVSCIPIPSLRHKYLHRDFYHLKNMSFWDFLSPLDGTGIEQFYVSKGPDTFLSPGGASRLLVCRLEHLARTAKGEYVTNLAALAKINLASHGGGNCAFDWCLGPDAPQYHLASSLLDT